MSIAVVFVGFAVFLGGVLAIVIVMEASRRTMGPLLPVIGMACLLYALLGRHMPGILAHRGYPVDRVVNHIYVGTEGIYGIAVGVVATYVFHFVLFGILAQMTGLGRLFMDLATIAAGRFSGCTGAAAGAASGGGRPGPPSAIQRMSARLPPKRTAMPRSESRTNRRTGSSCHGAVRRSIQQSRGNDWGDARFHIQLSDQSSDNRDCE